jgi:hypothetical protein
MSAPQTIATRLPDIVAGLVAAGAGLAIGWVDFHQDEPQPAVLLLLVSCGLLGLARPGGAWRWAVLVGAGIPVVAFAGHTLGWTPTGPPSSSAWGYLLPFIPALIGVYAGAFVRRAAVSLA